MSTSHRVSRGFHRLAIFLATIVLIVGTGFAVLMGSSEARRDLVSHQLKKGVFCAKHKIISDPWVPTIERGDRDYDDSACVQACSVPASSPCAACVLSGPARQRTTAVRPDYPVGPDDMVSLDVLGCPHPPSRGRVSVILRASDPGELSYASAFLPSFLTLFGVRIVAAFAIYGGTRAIGWVVGGFAAS